MNRSWLDELESPAGLGEAQFTAVNIQSAGAESDTSLLTEIGRILGEDAEPDAAFFVDSWTEGKAAAAEDFVRRRKAIKNGPHITCERYNFPSFILIGADKIDASAGAAWAPRSEYHETIPLVNEQPIAVEEQADIHLGDDSETACPLTTETAYRVLRISSASSREEIRTAYRRMANRYHPDRLARRGTREQKVANIRMASINEAYRLLCRESGGQAF